MASAYQTDVDMQQWGPGVTHWAAGDRYYAVLTDPHTDGKLPRFITEALVEIAGFEQVNAKTHQILPQPTQMVVTDENGSAIDADTSTDVIELITAYEFPPGTSAADALRLAGYDVAD